ncbi:hypothetical protein BKA62DRAFT_231111 [Auriculariales sp. MPI-PUGE-AT-0066]|nr:hypothetical protein BKA62DRAFT_231111 [Auriculariales sp. MPI-PUGE-AT-0066]
MSAATHDPSLTIFAPSRATSYASNRAVTPNTFSGTIEVTLGRAATLSKLTIALVGRVSGQMDPNGSPMTREMCQVSRRLARNTRLKIGVNSIRFNIHPMPSNLPPTSTHVGHQGDHGFSVTYELIARAKISYCCLSSKRRTEASVPVHMLLEHDCTGPAFVSPVQESKGRPGARSIIRINAAASLMGSRHVSEGTSRFSPNGPRLSSQEYFSCPCSVRLGGVQWPRVLHEK